jgi:hypothetical protein
MKRLFVLLTVVVMTMYVGVAAWAANPQDVDVDWNVDSWIILYVPAGDRDISLGTVDGSQYDPETETWTAITDGSSHSAYVISNSVDGFTLSVSAANATGYEAADLSRFQMVGGDLTAWTGDLSNTQILASSTAGIEGVTDIKYQYVPDWEDAPGKYQVIVTYTATAQ